MINFLSIIKAWGLDLSEWFGESRNIPPGDRPGAIEQLVIGLKKEGASRDDILFYIDKIVNECIPVDSDKRKKSGAKYAYYSVSNLIDVLNGHFESEEEDISDLTRKVCKKLGIPCKEKKQNPKGPGMFKKGMAASVPLSVISKTETIIEEVIAIEESEDEFDPDSVEELLRNKYTVSKKAAEEELLPISKEIMEEFGLNEKGEFDI